MKKYCGSGLVQLLKITVKIRNVHGEKFFTGVVSWVVDLLEDSFSGRCRELLKRCRTDCLNKYPVMFVIGRGQVELKEFLG